MALTPLGDTPGLTSRSDTALLPARFVYNLVTPLGGEVQAPFTRAWSHDSAAGLPRHSLATCRITTARQA